MFPLPFVGCDNLCCDSLPAMSLGDDALSLHVHNTLGISVREEWLAVIVASLGSSVAAFGTLPLDRRAEFVLQELLGSDLSHAALPRVPDEVLQRDFCGFLHGRYVFQVDEILDVSQPIKNRYEAGSRGRRCLKLVLNDGGRRVVAAELRPIPQLSADAAAGLKLAVTDAAVSAGVLLLRPENVDVLGGKVPALEAARKRALEEWAQPPRLEPPGRPGLNLVQRCRRAAGGALPAPAAGLPAAPGLPEVSMREQHAAGPVGGPVVGAGRVPAQVGRPANGHATVPPAPSAAPGPREAVVLSVTDSDSEDDWEAARVHDATADPREGPDASARGAREPSRAGPSGSGQLGDGVAFGTLAWIMRQSATGDVPDRVAVHGHFNRCVESGLDADKFHIVCELEDGTDVVEAALSPGMAHRALGTTPAQFSAMDEAGKRAARQRFQRTMATFSGVVVLAWPRLGAREGERPTIVSFEEGAEAAMVEALSAGAFQT